MDGMRGDSSAAGLTTGALARRLGVAPTTLRSWDRRYGIGPAIRPDGRHRRWTASDIAVLETMCRLTSAGVPPAEAARTARQLAAGPPAAGRAVAVAVGGAAQRTAPETPGEGLVPGAPTQSIAADNLPPGTATRRTTAGTPNVRRTPGTAARQTTTGTPDEHPTPGTAPRRAPAPTPGDSQARNARAQSATGRGASRAAGALPLGGVRQECRGLGRAAVRLDAPAVERQLASAVDVHGLVVAWREVMVPALHAVGRKWASSGDRYVEVEHLLSWHVSTTLRRAARPAAADSGGVAAPGPVVLACMPGEQHTLALEALHAGLSELGLPSRMFGAAVPAEALTSAVDRLGPTAVVLWAQARSTAGLPLARRIAGARWGVKGARRSPLVMLGGPGWLGRSDAGMPRPTSLEDALTTLGTLYGGEAASERGLSRGHAPV
ncbi:MerR family transcriptional regulator [Streptomyces sp. NPDC047042]|uniref:MerR family transcriptional regulator n=1 Tax=Streptomyces sp. NPDC047042 TaxID=3154807 RepID=UPI0033E23463